MKMFAALLEKKTPAFGDVIKGTNASNTTPRRFFVKLNTTRGYIFFFIFASHSNMQKVQLSSINGGKSVKPSGDCKQRAKCGLFLVICSLFFLPLVGKWNHG